MENTYDERARFSANNINILNISKVGDYYVAQYEFQWRSGGTVRWHKTFTELPKDVVEEDGHTLYHQFSEEILTEVQKVRSVLENGV